MQKSCVGIVKRRKKIDVAEHTCELVRSNLIRFTVAVCTRNDRQKKTTHSLLSANPKNRIERKKGELTKTSFDYTTLKTMMQKKKGITKSWKMSASFSLSNDRGDVRAQRLLIDQEILFSTSLDTSASFLEYYIYYW